MEVFGIRITTENFGWVTTAITTAWALYKTWRSFLENRAERLDLILKENITVLFYHVDVE